jgi:CubicO group peptidase (beta-lactamase class C family)
MNYPKPLSILVSISLLALLLPTEPASARRPRPPDWAELERVVRAELVETKTPGAAIAVISHERVLFAKGFGVASVETNELVTPDMLFHLGSLTKMFTAAALVTLAEEGKLKLDAPIGDYVKGLAPKISRLTAHQLLSQTSGLKDVPGDYGLHEEKALGDFVRSLTDQDVLVDGGGPFSYSNIGYALAGYLLEQVGGHPYADQMAETLFKPLGMTRATLRPTMAMTYPLAAGHAAQEQDAPRVVRPLADDARLWPAGYAFASLNDVARFVVALMNDGRIEGRQAFPPSVSARLLKPYVDIPTNVFARGRYGYGLFSHDYGGRRMIEHGGLLPGYSSEIRLLPEERVAVITLLNKEGVRLNQSFAKAFELLLAQQQQAAPAVYQPKASLPLTEAEMARYVGTYANRWTIEIAARDGKLYLKQFGVEAPVVKIGENRFAVTPPGAQQAQEFLLVPGRDNSQAAYLQMALWVFKRVQPTEKGAAQFAPPRKAQR